MSKLLGISNKRTTLNKARLLTLFSGPFITLFLYNVYSSNHNDALTQQSISLIIVLMWSPLFFSIPSLLCQVEIDANNNSGSYGKIAKFTSLYKKGSTVRTELILSINMWFLLIIWLAPTLNAALNHII